MLQKQRMVMRQDNSTPITPDFLNLFRNLIHKNLGIYISKEKDYLLESKLQKILTKSEFNNLPALYHSLKHDHKEHFDSLIQYITTNHTFFFREKEHLEILHNEIYRKNQQKPLIWCAGCSSGEEVYSIIIHLLEHEITDFFLVATDINKEVLIKCKKGVYSSDRVKNINQTSLNKYFNYITNNSEDYTIKEDIKKYFIIKKINLTHPVFFEKKFDYIFCRNVLIYFDKLTQQKVVNNLMNNLDDHGFLFVGHSETLFNLDLELKSVFTSVYKKKL